MSFSAFLRRIGGVFAADAATGLGQCLRSELASNGNLESTKRINASPIGLPISVSPFSICQNDSSRMSHFRRHPRSKAQSSNWRLGNRRWYIQVVSLKRFMNMASINSLSAPWRLNSESPTNHGIPTVEADRNDPCISRSKRPVHKVRAARSAAPKPEFFPTNSAMTSLSIFPRRLRRMLSNSVLLMELESFGEIPIKAE